MTSIALVVVGTWLCYKSITDSINQNIGELIASNLPQIGLKGDQPYFLFATEKVSNEWAHQQSTMQLYNAQGKLIEEFGPPGIDKLELHMDYFEARVGDHDVRGTCDPIKIRGRIVGYLQAEIPVELRNKATLEFAMTMAAIMPLLLIALALCGYFLSIKASKPVEQAFNLLKQFMSDASHELRTPVHAIQLMAENVAAEADEDSQLVKDMEGISKSTDRMARLIDDMMMLTKIEVQQLPLQQSAVRIDQLINHAVGELKQDFIDKQIALEVDKLDPITVEGDEHALHRVFTNLLGNALRYTDGGGTVSVCMNRSKNLVRVVVTDTGIGIDAQSLTHIFERFYRVDKSRARAQGGSGLGLSIVKAICEYHKGFVLVESEEGKGSTFTVILPCIPVPVAV